MLVSAAMISFRRIMLNININTYTIDFSSMLKEGVLEKKKGGLSCTEFNLVVSCQHRYPEIQTCLKPSLISLPDPILSFFFPLQKEMHYSELKTKALISVHSFSFTNPLQP